MDREAVKKIVEEAAVKILTQKHFDHLIFLYVFLRKASEARTDGKFPTTIDAVRALIVETVEALEPGEKLFGCCLYLAFWLRDALEGQIETTYLPATERGQDGYDINRVTHALLAACLGTDDDPVCVMSDLGYHIPHAVICCTASGGEAKQGSNTFVYGPITPTPEGRIDWERLDEAGRNPTNFGGHIYSTPRPEFERLRLLLYEAIIKKTRFGFTVRDEQGNTPTYVAVDYGPHSPTREPLAAGRDKKKLLLRTKKREKGLTYAELKGQAGTILFKFAELSEAEDALDFLFSDGITVLNGIREVYGLVPITRPIFPEECNFTQ